MTRNLALSPSPRALIFSRIGRETAIRFISAILSMVSGFWQNISPQRNVMDLKFSFGFFGSRHDLGASCSVRRPRSAATLAIAVIGTSWRTRWRSLGRTWMRNRRMNPGSNCRTGD
jgi:hypothetical protein